jgi:hypothetical protein
MENSEQVYLIEGTKNDGPVYSIEKVEKGTVKVNKAVLNFGGCKDAGYCSI